MSKPATLARQEAAAKGFTQVIGRGNSHIITKNPTTGKCAYDGQVGGGWHYGDGQETDTAWQTGTAPWTWDDIDDLEFGAACRCGNDPHSGVCTQTYLLIEWDYVIAAGGAQIIGLEVW